MIEITLRKRLGTFAIDVDVTLPGIGVCGLIGPSGSGKSSLFALLAGHARPDAGRIRIGGQTLCDTDRGIDIAPARRGIGLVFQDGLLFPHRTVRGNLLYAAGARPGGFFEEVVETLRLGPLLDRRPARLSGGERQRVAIGRALMAQPRLLLLDEPVSALDPALRDDVLRLLETVHSRTGTPMIYISHAPEEIRRLADIVVTLKDGRITDIARHPSPRVGGDTFRPTPLRKIV